MKKSPRPLILVSNDDGVRADGIIHLQRALRRVGHVVVVAPDGQRSAASHSITLHRPLRVKKMDTDVYAVDGTPTDCVMLAVHELLDRHPDLVVSGINHGPNLGDDVHYSGTVSVAMEGAIIGIPAVAVSLVSNGGGGVGFPVAARFAAKLARQILASGLPRGVLLNVNVPDTSASQIKGAVVTHQGKRDYGDIIVEKVDPKGRIYYWIGGDEAGFEDRPHSDCNAAFSDHISVTPLRVNMTDAKMLEELKTWKMFQGRHS